MLLSGLKIVERIELYGSFLSEGEKIYIFLRFIYYNYYDIFIKLLV